LKQAIVKCPPDLWDALEDKDKFWFKAYHALYYTHLYLQDDRKDFVRWRKDGKPVGRGLLSQADVLAYLAFVEQEVGRRVPAIHLEAAAGFGWSRMNNSPYADG